MPGAGDGIFSTQISLQRTSSTEQSTTFPQIISPLSYPIENGRISGNPGQVLATSTGSSSASSVQPDKHPNVLHLLLLWIFMCRALELLCVQAWVVLHSRCVWCSVVASSLLLGWISQSQLCTLVFLPLKLFQVFSFALLIYLVCGYFNA